jgi:hypothetical protein
MEAGRVYYDDPHVCNTVTLLWTQVEVVVVDLDPSLAQGVMEVPALDLGVEVLLNEIKFLREEAEPESA